MEATLVCRLAFYNPFTMV